jgi:hypothetical protein
MPDNGYLWLPVDRKVNQDIQFWAEMNGGEHHETSAALAWSGYAPGLDSG